MIRQELAKLLWEKCEEAIPSALAATIIYYNLWKRCGHHNSELRDAYQQNKNEFEMLAIKVLETCSSADNDAAVLMVECR